MHVVFCVNVIKFIFVFREWNWFHNSRGYEVLCCEMEHVSVSKLKEDPSVDPYYLGRTYIPAYPNAVFRVSRVCHVTGESGLRSIFRDAGFRKPYCRDDNFLWWSLSATQDDIAFAEKNLLEETFPGVQNPNQQPFLEKFTTSPAFQSESRYGNFRFTFSLKALLFLYKKQFCDKSLVLRVLDTKLYQKEVLYTVLVHPPNVKCYDQYPRLPQDDEDAVCGYAHGSVIWRCQAPSDSHRYALEVDKGERLVHARSRSDEVYYVWDHVAVAFHMQPDWNLRVELNQLLSHVSVCEVTEFNLLREPDTPLSVSDAQALLESLRERSGQASSHYR